MRGISRRLFAWTTIAVLTTVVGLGAPPATALAAGGVDQQQTTILSLSGGDTVGGLSHQKVAQVVQAGMGGDLVAVDLPAECAGASTLTVEIRGTVSANGRFSPGTTVLASIVVAAANLPPLDATNFRSFAFQTAASFAVGDRFAIVLSATGPGALDSCLLRQGPAGDSYASGDGWFVNDQQVSPFTPGGWMCKCDAGPLASFDYAFRTRVQPTADLSITKTLVNPNNLNVFAGTEQIYRITVTNAGPAAATGLKIVDTLPPNVTVVEAPCPVIANVMTCIPPVGLPAGTSQSLSFRVTFNNAGSYLNEASVSANETDPNTANNSSSHTQQVLPTADLSLEEMSASPGFASPGGRVTYTAIVRNLGPDPAVDVTLMQTIPVGTTLPTTQCAIGTSVSVPSANEYGCRFSAGIPVGATRSVEVTVTVPTTPQMMTGSATATHDPTPLVFDPVPPQGARSTFTGFRSWVFGESLPPQTVTAGGTATTDTEADGATPDDPVETTVKSPTGGTVSITEQELSLPSGSTTNWTFLGAEVVISAPAGTKAAPLILTFRLDKTAVEHLKIVPPGSSADFRGAPVQVFRNETAVLTPVPPVPDCPLSGTPPQPTLPLTSDPCVASRTILADGDLEIVVYTSQASVWSFATRRPFGSIRFEPPLGRLRNAGSTLPVKFTLFDGSGQIVSEAGLSVLVGGSPSSRGVTCGTGAPLEDWAVASIVGGGLHFDEDTSAYSVNWKTDAAWTGTCRQLQLRLIDGSEHTTLVEFR